MSGASERTSPVLTSLFLFVPDHSASTAHSSVKYPFWNSPPIYAGAGNFFPADAGPWADAGADAGPWAFDSSSNSIYEQTETLGSQEGLAGREGKGSDRGEGGEMILVVVVGGK